MRRCYFDDLDRLGAAFTPSVIHALANITVLFAYYAVCLSLNSRTLGQLGIGQIHAVVGEKSTRAVLLFACYFFSNQQFSSQAIYEIGST